MNTTKIMRRMLTILLSAVMCLSAASIGFAETEANQTTYFDDVLPGHWYYSAIKFVVDNGYFNGVSESTFAPDAPMTRAMFVTVLGRYAGVEETTPKTAGTVFIDVEPGSYFCEYVDWAVENGITQGMSQNIFGYAENVTREQVAVFLYRYAQLIGLDVRIEQTAQPNTFNSGVNTSPWAMTAVVWASSKGILNGIGNGMEPKAVVTRAQVAQIMMNFAQFAQQA